jgi:Tol biopolymer transport system component
MDDDGRRITQITDSAENELGKSWSPDGTQVVADFGIINPPVTHLAKGDIAVINVNGGSTVNLTNTPGINEEHPNWSP